MAACKSEFDALMTLDIGRHIGRWIAVVGCEIVSVGDSGKEVFQEAKRKHPNKEPFVMKVPRDEIMLL